MAISSIVAAKKLCELSDWSLTNLQLQKILYIAHMVSLGRNDAPLLSDTFEAWDYGPVAPALYHWVKTFGSKPVKNIFRRVASPQDPNDIALLTEAYEHLSGISASRLVAATHRQNGAWAKHYHPGMNAKIPNDSIRAEYMTI